MSNVLLRTAVRTMFLFTSRRRATARTRRWLRRYLELTEGLGAEEGARSVRVPPMRGVDEDMRDWSAFQILEHNVIVNRSISAIVAQLGRGEALGGPALIDAKTGVMPSGSPGEEQVAAFRESVEDHLRLLTTLGRLRGTETAPHPVFGALDAHMWNCVFAFHLWVHFPQLAFVVREATEGNG